MGKNTEIETVKGTFDITPGQYYIYNEINEKLKKCFESYGYKGIIVPVVENSELYLRKSGNEITSKMYSFKDYGNRNICLRPELTASIARAYLNRMRNKALPVKLHYLGPSFRYDNPQLGRYRQFTQAGIELIGSNSPLADAEIIWIACKGLDLLGLRKYKLIIGHIGFITEFLEKSGLTERVKRMLLKNMESLSKGETIKGIRSKFNKLGIIQDKNLDDNGIAKKNFQKYFEDLDYPKAKKIVFGLLEVISSGIDGNRIPEEVAERLLFKLKSKNQRKDLERALKFIKRLTKIKGEPKKVLINIKALIEDYELDEKPIIELENVIEKLYCFDIDWQKVCINLGFGRGLDYYTGLIFEINYDGLGPGQKQICGGGRYDDLIKILGGDRRTPALGFAYGIERIKIALEIEKVSSESEKNRLTDIFIIPIGNAVFGYVIKVAELLREKGLKVEVDVLERKIKRNLEYADKMNIPYTIFIGEDEQKESIIKLRDNKTKKEKTILFKQLINSQSILNFD